MTWAKSIIRRVMEILFLQDKIKSSLIEEAPITQRTGTIPPERAPHRTHRKGESLSFDEREIFYLGKCPDCKGTLYEGPSGGGSINIYCGNDDCGSRFNEMGPFGVDRISDASPMKRTGESSGVYR